MANYLQEQRDGLFSSRLATDRRIMEALGPPIVKGGPFKGMIYPASNYSHNFAKIVGSYEREISDIIEILCRKEFTEIVNIGCAEGYYAVGFARRNNRARITAYDGSERARWHCEEMARLNGVEKQIRVLGLFTKESLFRANLDGAALIICDCEGDEKTIFTPENISRLRNCELLIELHDFVDISISEYIRNLFSETHEILAVPSTDDIFKARNYHFKETDHLDLHLKKLVFEEHRPAPMEWFYMTPKSLRR
jgi:hypothetical protein